MLAHLTCLPQERPKWLSCVACRSFILEEIIIMAKWKVIRVLNNNAVLVGQENGQESVLLGKGIGYKSSPKSEVDMNLVTKQYTLSSHQEAMQYTYLLETNQLYGTVYNENQAATITQHFVSAASETSWDTIQDITKIINEILVIVSQYCSLNYNENSYTYYRFVVHLRFFPNVC